LKHILPGLLTLLIGIVLVLPTAAPTLADSDNVTPVPPVGIQALIIKVDNTVELGQPVTITVVSRRSNETIAGATVYAIKTSGRVGPADPANYTTLNSEFEALTESDGISIGKTGSDGTVSATLAVAGRYLLIATKDGFIPGFARLNVKQVGAKAKLNLKVTVSSPSGQQVMITVTESISGQATENATVYALKVENTRDIKQKPLTANNGKPVVGPGPNYADRARENGVLAGSTDSAGQVSYNFPSPGQYILAAFKEGYAPAVTRTGYLQPISRKALYIKAPTEANAGDAVNIAVYSDNGTAVSRAAVYSVRLDSIKEGPSLLKSLPGLTGDAKEKYVPLLKDKSLLSGYTDENGQLTLKFARPGSYLLLAIKDSLIPDFTRINILQVAALTPVPVPQTSPGQSVQVSPQQVTQSHGNGEQSHGDEVEDD
jgi:hypothetical protein